MDLKKSFSRLNIQVKLLVAARLISAITSGFILFCAPIYFIDNQGLSASIVGMGLGAGGVASLLGRVIGGLSADDNPTKRLNLLLVSLAMMTVGCFLLSSKIDFLTFVIGSMVSALGFGLFSPAADALVADITDKKDLNLAYGYNRLATWSGLGTGLLIGSQLMQLSGTYLLLFSSCAILFLVLIALLARSSRIVSFEEPKDNVQLLARVKEACHNKRLGLYSLLNVGMTSNTILVMTAAPLYIMHCLSKYPASQVNESSVFPIFLGFILLCALTQMPIARFSSRLSPSAILISATFLWTVAALMMWLNNQSLINPILLSSLTMIVLALASSFYGPGASLYMVSMAPENARALYLSVNSMCWGVARLFAPSLGLMMVGGSDQSASSLWLFVALINALILIPGLIMINNNFSLNRSAPVPVTVNKSRY